MTEVECERLQATGSLVAYKSLHNMCYRKYVIARLHDRVCWLRDLRQLLVYGRPIWILLRWPEFRATPIENPGDTGTSAPVDPIQDPIDLRSIDGQHPKKAEKLDPITAALHATPANFTADQLAHARQWIHGYRAKCGPYARDRGEVPHPPDDAVLAHIITAAQPWTVEDLVRSLMIDRPTPGEKYEWWVAVALQRVHGIEPGQLRARRGIKGALIAAG